MSAVVLLAGLIATVNASTGSAQVEHQWPGGRWQPDAPSYGMAVVKNRPVRMDDGVILYADIGYPTDLATGKHASGTFPVLLTQNPYSPIEPPDKYFVSRGYIFVVADVRGTQRSEAPNGKPLAFDLFGPRDAKDGVELVDWAAHQLTGSNGVVGLTGCSFLGINQLFTAAAIGANSPIAAILPACAWTAYEDYFAGGIPSNIAGLFAAAGSILGPKHIAENIESGKRLSEDIKAGGRSAYNGAYWRSRDTTLVIPDIVRNGIPALMWSGWGATEVGGVFDQYAIFQNAYAGRDPFGPMSASQAVTGRYQVIIGSGEHGSGLDPAIELEWFDRWLKHDRNGIDETATPMHLYEMQGSRWINTDRDPIVESYAREYLDTGGALAAAPPGAGHQSLTWGSATTEHASATFTAPAATKPVTLAGPIAATVWASSTNTNMELVATVDDVAPDGLSQTITHGALLGSMRATNPNETWLDANQTVIKPAHPFTHDVYLRPASPQRLDISFLPTLWRIQPGHRIRLTVATQSTPKQCEITLKTGLPQAWPCLLTAPQQQTLPGGVYDIRFGGGTASALALPLLDATQLKTARGGVTSTSNKASVPLDWGALSTATRPTGTSASPSSGSSSLTGWIVAIVVLIIALVFGAVLFRRRRSAAKTADPKEVGQ